MIPSDNRWLLPDGVEEILPPQAARLERLRGVLLRLFHSWGYDLVIPPLVDHLESLLTGAGEDLERRTFKLVDQYSGRLLGLRADMTPQVARIDAHHLRRECPVRLCYFGTVLHTYGDHLEPSRSPLQIGAELYGHGGLASDLEVLRLMLEMLAIAGVPAVHLDLGHVGVYRQLAAVAGLSVQAEIDVFQILQRKSQDDLAVVLADYGVAAEVSAALRALVKLNGGVEVLDEAYGCLARFGAGLVAALDTLRSVVSALRTRYPALPVHIDLAELRGYHYQTGLVFAAFVPGYGREIARGGRYDEIGRVFGRARPATGFSADLKILARLADDWLEESDDAIFAPWADNNPALHDCVRDLRAQGRRVVQELPGQSGGAEALGCRYRLELSDAGWHVVPV